MTNIIITTNGDYRIVKPRYSGSSCIYLTGTAGGATVKLGFLDNAAAFHEFVDGTITVDEQVLLTHGYGVEVLVRIEGATGTTSINLVATAA